MCSPQTSTGMSPRVLPDTSSTKLWCLASLPYPSQDSVPEAPTLSGSCFIVSLSNVLVIKLICNTYWGLQNLSPKKYGVSQWTLWAMPCLYDALVFPSGAWSIAGKSRRQVKCLFGRRHFLWLLSQSEVIFLRLKIFFFKVKLDIYSARQHYNKL